MDDGIELNFATSSGDGANAGAAVGHRKKQGGRWTDRLKANRATKHRSEKASKPSSLPLTRPDPAPSTSRSTLNQGDLRNGRDSSGHANGAASSSRSNVPASGPASTPRASTYTTAASLPLLPTPSNYSARPTPRPSASTNRSPAQPGARQQATGNTDTDDFANVDISALARLSSTTSSTSRPRPSQSSAFTSQAHTYSQAQNQGQGPGIVSRLFTGISGASYARPGEGQEGEEEDEEGEEGRRRREEGASNAPLPASNAKAQVADEEQEAGVGSTSRKGKARSTDSSTFEGLGLDPLLVKHLKDKMGIERPTRIQRAVLGGGEVDQGRSKGKGKGKEGLLDVTPLTIGSEAGKFSLLDHTVTASTATAPNGLKILPTRRDAFIQSQTGSGKTLSYLLPILQTLIPLASSRDVGYVDRSIGTLAIVLAPTRELARQIWGVTERMLGLGLSMVLDEEEDEGEVKVEDGEQGEEKRKTPIYQRYLVSTLLTGGSTRTHEKSRLRKGCPILISTPGRLLDHLQNTQSFRCDKLLYLVLDEADRLIEEGFGETLAGIMKALEGRRKLGIEMDGEGLGRSARRKFKPEKVVLKTRLPFEEEDSSSDDGDSDYDYELSGPRKSKSKMSEAAVQEEEVIHDVEQEEINHRQMKWPYWSLGRRTILCSATVSGEVQKLAGVALKDPVMYRANDAGKTAGETVDEPELKEIVPLVNVEDKGKVEEDIIEPEGEATVGKTKEEKFTPPSQLDQRYLIVPLKLRLVTLVALLRSLVAKASVPPKNGEPAKQGMKVIVFMSCTDSVDFHWKMLGGVQMGQIAVAKEDESDEEGENKKKSKPAKGEEDPISFSCPLLPSTSIMRLHGSLPLQTRRTSLEAFAKASLPTDPTSTNQHSILFCTSVASRGLDLPLVRAVIQYDLPTEQGISEYVHRVGRTARVGRGGESWAFVEPAEKEWVPWVLGGMSEDKKDGGAGDGVRLRQVIVEDVLRKGFAPKGGEGREFEQRASQVQLAFERWVLENSTNASLARQAFSSYVRAYSTHPSEEKRFFHVKNLHLGHLAKAFGLRDTPGKIGGGAGSNNTKNGSNKRDGGKGDHKHNGSAKRKRGAEDSDDDNDFDISRLKNTSGTGHSKVEGKASAAKTDAERRMYEAVRKQGRLTKVEGKLGVGAGAGAAGGADGEYQVMGSVRELEKMVGGGGGGKRSRKF